VFSFGARGALHQTGLSEVGVYLLSQHLWDIHRYRFIYFNWFVVNGHD